MRLRHRVLAAPPSTRPIESVATHTPASVQIDGPWHPRYLRAQVAVCWVNRVPRKQLDRLIDGELPRPSPAAHARWQYLPSETYPQHQYLA
jgi:hypothetical protein